MIRNEFSPSHYTDLTFEVESGSIHITSNHIFQDFFRGFSKSIMSSQKWNPLKKGQGIYDLKEIEGSVFAHSSEICVVRGWKFITYHINPGEDLGRENLL